MMLNPFGLVGAALILAVYLFCFVKLRQIFANAYPHAKDELIPTSPEFNHRVFNMVCWFGCVPVGLFGYFAGSVALANIAKDVIL